MADTIRDRFNSGYDKSSEYLRNLTADAIKLHDEAQGSVWFSVIKTTFILIVLIIIIVLSVQVFKYNNDEFDDTEKKVEATNKKFDETISKLSQTYLESSKLDSMINAYNFAKVNDINKKVDEHINTKLPILSSIERAIKDMNTNAVNASRTDDINKQINDQIALKLAETKQKIDDQFNTKFSILMAIDKSIKDANAGTTPPK
jgi:hypothetical protein